MAMSAATAIPRLTDKSLDQVSWVIDALDFEPIKFKLALELGWRPEDLERVELLYRRFLFLIAKYPNESIVPTKEIDEFWHTHILDTRKYESDTVSVFGQFLHHFPYFGLRGKADRTHMEESFLATAKLYALEFRLQGPEYITGGSASGAVCDGAPCQGRHGEPGGYGAFLPRPGWQDRPKAHI